MLPSGFGVGWGKAKSFAPGEAPASNGSTVGRQASLVPLLAEGLVIKKQIGYYLTLEVRYSQK